MLGRRITILVGHFGSGKSEIAINLACAMAETTGKVALVDLDVVKPYFRSRAARAELARCGIELIAPEGENYYADLPILLPQVRAACMDRTRHVVIDAGGNDTGVRALGSLRDVIVPEDTSVFLVVNFRRPLTPDAAAAVAMARDIERTARLDISGVISNTHLLDETTADVIREGLTLAAATAEMLGVAVVDVAAEKRVSGEIKPNALGCPVIELQRSIRPVFDCPPKVLTRGPLFVMG